MEEFEPLLSVLGDFLHVCSRTTGYCERRKSRLLADWHPDKMHLSLPSRPDLRRESTRQVSASESAKGLAAKYDVVPAVDLGQTSSGIYCLKMPWMLVNI